MSKFFMKQKQKDCVHMALFRQGHVFYLKGVNLNNQNEKIVARLNVLKGDMSVRDFAKHIDAKQVTTNNYFNGRPLHIDAICKICKTFGVSADWLLFGEKQTVIEPLSGLQDKLTSLKGLSKSLDDEIAGINDILVKRTRAAEAQKGSDKC